MKRLMLSAGALVAALLLSGCNQNQSSSTASKPASNMGGVTNASAASTNATPKMSQSKTNAAKPKP